MTALPLTAPRRTALLVLYDLDPCPARYSNRTDLEDLEVYWQSADWLVQKGLARLVVDRGCRVRITAAGRRLAGELRAAGVQGSLL